MKATFILLSMVFLSGCAEYEANIEIKKAAAKVCTDKGMIPIISSSGGIVTGCMSVSKNPE